MIRFTLCLFSTLCLSFPVAKVPSLLPVERITAPARPDDVVFVDSGQILVMTSETSNQKTGDQRCHLSMWDMTKKDWILTKTIDPIPPRAGQSPALCGHMTYLPSLNGVALVSKGEILIVDTHTLEVAQKISVWPNSIAYVSIHDGLIYALSQPGVKPAKLTSYYLRNGALVQETVIPELDVSLAKPVGFTVTSGNQLAFVQPMKQSLVASGENSVVRLCAREDGSPCRSVVIPTLVADVLPFGDSLLLVSGDFPDHSSRSRSQCIEKLALSTLQVDPQAYCRPGAGVHYSLAALGNGFVLGYSGHGASWGWLDDGLLVNRESSISVWEAKSARLIAIAPLPHGRSFTLTSSVIRVDMSGRNQFLFYNPIEGREILLYDLSVLGQQKL